MDIRVLIVDDAKELREMIAREITDNGIQIVGEAASGPEALLVASDAAPDVIILDYLMPGMTGEEAARGLRAQDPTIKIVACSGVVQSKPYWADAYVDKSKLDSLRGTVSALMEGSSSS
jgi:two-component system, chemotaxis family, chemotaxis protein CheY